MKKFYILFLVFNIFILSSLKGESALSYFQKGEKYFSEKDYDNALYYYKKSLMKNRYYTKSLYKLALINKLLGNKKEEEKYLKRLIKINPYHLNALLMLTDLYISKNKIKEAERICKKLLKKYPLNYDATIYLAKVYMIKKYYPYAEKKLKEAIKIDNNRAEAYIVYGELEIIKKRYKKAEEFLKKALYYEPDNYKGYFYYGVLNVKKGNISEAVNYFSKAYNLNSEDTSIIFNLSDLYFKLQNWDKAEEFLKKALKNYSDLYILYYKLGLVYQFKDMFDEAGENYKKALNLKSSDVISRYIYENNLIKHFSFYNPDRIFYSRFHIKRAKEYENKNQLMDALYEYKRGLKLFSEKWQDRYNLALLYKKMGFLEKYLKELKLAYTLNPEKIELKFKYEMALKFKEKRLSYKLKINQYDIPKDKVKILVLNFKAIDNQYIHNYAGKIIADSISENFLLYNKFKNYDFIDNKYYFIQDRNDIKKIAMKNGFDYYAYGFYKENEDYLYVNFDIYSVKRDESIKKIEAISSGKDRLYLIGKNVVKKLFKFFPTTGKIIDKKDNYIVINLGLADGLKIRDKIEIYSNESIEKDFTFMRFFRKNPHKKATATIYKLDEQISLAKLDSGYKSWNINLNDRVKVVKKKK